MKRILPCITPGARIWDTKDRRRLNGILLLAAQGMFVESDFPAWAQKQFTNSFLTDLAGNAMPATVCQVVTIAALAHGPTLSVIANGQ